VCEKGVLVGRKLPYLLFMSCLPFSPAETQLSRMIKRDSDKGLTPEDANHRLNSQLALEKKLPYADIVLDNADGASETLEEQINRVVKKWHQERSQGLGRVTTLLQWLVPPFGILMAAWSIGSRIARVNRRKKQDQAETRSE
jgi:dephospho-CoA kinase